MALISLISISDATATGFTFTTDLIHRDSPHSPFHDGSSLLSQRLINALKRSVHRARCLKQRQQRCKPEPEPDLTSAGGEYLVKFSIGTPPVPTIAIADTGSDVVWTQCRPCLQCFNQSLPLFSPRHSSSYARVSCNTPTCNTLPQITHCSRTRRNCRYLTMYGDGSFTDGILATENFTFASDSGKTVVVPNVVFGCGFRNGGIFSGIESGIVGLGGGKASLVRQLGQGKFSYCLVPINDHNNSSKLNFGGGAEISGRGAVSTPLVVKKGMETFYYLTLEGISVGKKRLEFYDGSSTFEEGNVIIDSGTTLTMLPGSLYVEVEKAVKRAIRLKRINDPSGVMDLCFATRGQNMKDFPEITIHFKGADVKWRFENAFVRTSGDSVCFAAKAFDDDGLAIYGNLAQGNFLVGYDLRKRTVSFKFAHCGRS